MSIYLYFLSLRFPVTLFFRFCIFWLSRLYVTFAKISETFNLAINLFTRLFNCESAASPFITLQLSIYLYAPIHFNTTQDELPQNTSHMQMRGESRPVPRQDTEVSEELDRFVSGPNACVTIRSILTAFQPVREALPHLLAPWKRFTAFNLGFVTQRLM